MGPNVTILRVPSTCSCCSCSRQPSEPSTPKPTLCSCPLRYSFPSAPAVGVPKQSFTLLHGTFIRCPCVAVPAAPLHASVFRAILLLHPCSDPSCSFIGDPYGWCCSWSCSCCEAAGSRLIQPFALASGHGQRGPQRSQGAARQLQMVEGNQAAGQLLASA